MNRDFVDLLTTSKIKIDIFSSSILVTTLFSDESFLQLLADMQGRRSQRLITEITPSNLKLCKVLANVMELRHASGIKGVVLIVDDVFFAVASETSVHEHSLAFTKLNSPELVEQQNFLFEMLWEKAIPATHRIQEIEQGIPIENTELIQGTDNIVRKQVEGLASAKSQHDACCDQNFPASLVSSGPVWNICNDMMSRGILFRTITEITPTNLEYCKKMMTKMSLRHINDIKGNFSIADKSVYRGAATMRPGEPPTQGILSTSKIFVEMQQYFFETLWNKAIPAEQRIKEIEEGIAPEIIETFSDTSKTQEFADRLVCGAEKELLVMFASIKEYKRQSSENGFLSLLSQISTTKKNLNIRITMPDGVPADIDEGTKGTDMLSGQKIAIRHFDAPLSTMITIIVVDRKYALAIELRDDSPKSVADGASGLAIYSNSKALVMSYVSIFELLWTHIDLYQEIKMREQAQKEFIDIAVHELRAPIQPILGLAEEIHARQNENPEGRLLGIILRSATNLQRLADNLLDVARIQNNSLKLRLTNFDLNELVSSILADYAIDAARNRGIGIEFVRSKTPLQIQADRDRIYQVITNCLQNSLKFSEKGKIVVSSNEKDGHALLSIKDNGSGIDPSILPQLFTKYTSGAFSQGTGLGLFISKRIIVAHGGNISGANNVGEQGATFTFSVPISKITSPLIDGQRS